MKMIFTAAALALALAGCTPGDTNRAVVGNVDTIWAKVNGMMLTYDKANELPLQGTVEGNGIMPNQTDIPSTMSSRPDGSFEMTGPGVVYHGLAAFCRVAVNSPICGANPPPGLLAGLPPLE